MENILNKRNQLTKGIKNLSPQALKSLEEALRYDPELIFEGLRDTHLQSSKLRGWTRVLSKIFTDEDIEKSPEILFNLVLEVFEEEIKELPNVTTMIPSFTLFQHDIDNFCKIQDRFGDTHASVAMAANAEWKPNPVFDFEINQSQLQAFCKMLDIIDWLGSIEHSGDWDPALIITLTSGRVVETEPGYFQCRVEGSNLIVEGPDEENLDKEELEEMPPQYSMTDQGGRYIFPIANIANIEFYPH